MKAFLTRTLIPGLIGIAAAEALMFALRWACWRGRERCCPDCGAFFR